jgi:putative tricarboxylic transport membrane protein
MNAKQIIMLVLLAIVIVGLVGCSGPAYPAKPLEIVAPSGEGGGWDTLARTMMNTLTAEKLYSQPISVVNKVGSGGGLGLQYVVGKKADDYELVVYSPPLIINTLNKTFTTSYKELTPLAKLITDYQVFLVKADAPYKTMTDLLADIKRNPQTRKFGGASSAGSMDHLAFAKVAKNSGINPKDVGYISYNSAAEAFAALEGNAVLFLSTDVSTSLAQLQANKVRALAVSSPTRRSGALKDVPTLKEAGINVTYEVWRGVFGPPGMPKEAQTWWAGTLKQMVATKTWQDSLAKLQWTDAYANADDFAKFLADEEKFYTEFMTELGFAK